MSLLRQHDASPFLCSLIMKGNIMTATLVLAAILAALVIILFGLVMKYPESLKIVMFCAPAAGLGSWMGATLAATGHFF